MARVKPPISIPIFLLLLALFAFPIEGTMRLTAWIGTNDQPATKPGHSPDVGHSINNSDVGKVKSLLGRRRQLMLAGETTDEDCLCTADKMLSKIEDEVNRLLKDRGLKVME